MSRTALLIVHFDDGYPEDNLLDRDDLNSRGLRNQAIWIHHRDDVEVNISFLNLDAQHYMYWSGVRRMHPGNWH
jgi:hypothetical protein